MPKYKLYYKVKESGADKNVQKYDGRRTEKSWQFKQN